MEMNRTKNNHSEIGSPDPERQMSCFLPFVDVRFQPSNTCVSFGMTIEVMKLLRSHREGLSY